MCVHVFKQNREKKKLKQKPLTLERKAPSILYTYKCTVEQRQTHWSKNRQTQKTECVIFARQKEIKPLCDEQKWIFFYLSLILSANKPPKHHHHHCSRKKQLGNATLGACVMSNGVLMRYGNITFRRKEFSFLLVRHSLTPHSYSHPRSPLPNSGFHLILCFSYQQTLSYSLLICFIFDSHPLEIYTEANMLFIT